MLSITNNATNRKLNKQLLLDFHVQCMFLHIGILSFHQLQSFHHLLHRQVNVLTSHFTPNNKQKLVNAYLLLQLILVQDNNVVGERFDQFHRELIGIHQLTNSWEQMYMELHIYNQMHGLSSFSI